MYSWLIIINVIFSWLINMQIINLYHPLVRQIQKWFLYLTEPVLKFIRYYVPPVQGLDFSPALLLILIELLRYIIITYLLPVAFY